MRSSPKFKDYSRRVVAGSQYEDDLNDIIDKIGGGYALPDRYYRAGIDRDEDRLLDEQGIMHLHLGGRDSDVLLFLVQYEDRVVLLEINSHKHFTTEPKGTLLRALHDQALQAQEREEDEKKAARKELIRNSLRPRPKTDDN